MTKYCDIPEQQYNVVIESRQYQDSEPPRCLFFPIPRGSVSVRHVPSERRSKVSKVSEGMLPFIGNPAVLCTSRLATTFRRFTQRSCIRDPFESEVPRCAPRLIKPRNRTDNVVEFRRLPSSSLSSYPSEPGFNISTKARLSKLLFTSRFPRLSRIWPQDKI
jgi:hypothetical protein